MAGEHCELFHQFGGIAGVAPSFAIPAKMETASFRRDPYFTGNAMAINNDFTFDLYDDLNSLPENGIFSISLIGDEIVAKRRERALRSLKLDGILVEKPTLRL